MVSVEFWTHFGIDWFRGRQAANKPVLADTSGQTFWFALGVDQLLHALVLVGIAWMALA